MNGPWRAYLELLRLPAVFTAIADVMMGYLVRRGDLEPPHVFALLVAASSALYLSGMVLNDVVDAADDARDRPERPIPSERVGRRSAAILGWSLMGSGLAAAWTAYFVTGDRGPAGVATVLAIFVCLYNGLAKRMSIGPIVMGGCRTLNVLLGMSLVGAVGNTMDQPWTTTELFIAAGVGMYIAGVTTFSRSEARPGHRGSMIGGLVVMLVGILMLEVSGRIELRPADRLTEQAGWPLLWFALAAIIAGRCLWAIWRREPRATQVAVRNSLRAQIVIDATIVAGFCGTAWAMSVLALAIPMLLLERWISTT